MNHTLVESLPKVYLEKAGKFYNLHWDAQDVEADLVLDEKRLYVEGVIDGCCATLKHAGHNIPERSYSHRSGYVQGLIKETADILLHVIADVLHTLVTARYNKLQQEKDKTFTRNDRNPSV